LNEILETAGHQISMAVDVGLVSAWYGSSTAELPEVILLDTGNARSATDVTEIAQSVRALKSEALFKNTPVIAVLTARAKPDAYEALRVSEVDDFLRDDSPEGEIKARLEIATQLMRARAELAATREVLARQTRVDDLTGVMSRRFFFQQAHRECSRARRYGGALSCLMVEVDHFRLLNTTFGYAAGDWVLRTVADTLAQWTRDSDLVARFAENKFVVLLPETPIDGATQAREKIQNALAQQDWTYEGRLMPVTVSIGEAELRPENKSVSEAESGGNFEDEDGEAEDESVSRVPASISTREALADLLQDGDAALFIARRGARTPDAFVPYTSPGSDVTRNGDGA
jgi:diguanylate cyclase (GGDEF)-like protein